MALILAMEGRGGAGRRLDQGRLSLGREGCDWILPDPTLELSRQHCVIESNRDGYRITDTSKNGVYLNGAIQPLGPGRSAPLHDGDHIRIGNYSLSVRIVDDVKPLPNADVTAGETSADDPFGIEERRERERVRPAEQASAEGVFDKTWIGCQKQMPQPPRRSSGLRQDDPVLVRGDHSPPERDHLPPLRQPTREEAQRQQRAEQGPAAVTSSQPPSGSGDDLYDRTYLEFAERGSLSDRQPDKKGKELQPRPEPAAEPAEKPAPPQAQAPATDSGIKKEVGSSATSASSEAAGLRRPLNAFLQGAGVSPAEVPLNDVEAFMKQAGENYSLLCEGLRQLLIARANVKDMAGLDQTQIQHAGNNPLKASANAQEATRALLVHRGPGYLEPGPALRASFRDLFTHEVATMEGLQAALTALLERFDPEVLENEAASASAVSVILAGGRKASCWDAFRQRYGEVARRTRQHFLGDFNYNFKQAYTKKVGEIGGHE